MEWWLLALLLIFGILLALYVVLEIYSRILNPYANPSSGGFMQTLQTIKDKCCGSHIKDFLNRRRW